MSDPKGQIPATVTVGDYVQVAPLPGFYAAAGVVTEVIDGGFNLQTLPTGPESPLTPPIAVLMERAASVARAVPPSTLVRVYRGKQQADTAPRLQQDTDLLGRAGYKPTTQSWAQGQWGCGAWLVALVLCILLIGILVFLYMLIVKPDGSLNVTFERRPELDAPRDAAPASSKPVISDPAVRVEQRLAALDRLRASGSISDDEYAARRERILDEI